MEISLAALILGTFEAAAYDKIKDAWQNLTRVSLTEMYISSFRDTFEAMKPHWSKRYTNSGDELVFDKDAFRNSLNEVISVDDISFQYYETLDDEFFDQLTQAMMIRNVLLIGGNQLSEDDWKSLCHQFVEAAQRNFEARVNANPMAFHEIVVDLLKNNQAQVSNLLASLRGDLSIQVRRISEKLTELFKLSVSNDGMYSFEEWSEIPSLRISLDYHEDAARTRFISELAAHFASPPSYLRLEGLGGIGKSRLAFEAVRINGLVYCTIYASEYQAIPDNWFIYVSKNVHTRLILIVDECTYDETQELIQRSQRCRGKVLCITIGTDMPAYTGKTEEGAFHYDISKLDTKIIEQIVKDAAPILPWELRQFVIDRTEGFVKLALVVAEALSHRRDLASAIELTHTPNVNLILSAVVESNEERQAMKVFSLLPFIGTEGEVSTEAKIVCQFLGLDFRLLRSIEPNLTKKGILVKRGRFRHVTPTLLATWYAHEVWNGWQGDMIDLWSQLPNISSKHRLLRRLGDVGDESLSNKFVHRLFAEESIFSTIDTLDSDSESYSFLLLSRASPETAIVALERLVSQATHERLLEFNQGRRNIIFALEELVQLDRTSYDAARILQKFAAAENETWGNNATGIWASLFYLRNGGNPISGLDRIELIKDAMSGEFQDKVTAIHAIEKFLANHEMRSVGPPTGGYLPSNPWLPTTWEEFWNLRSQVLDLLSQLLRDDNTSIRDLAYKTLLNSIRSQIGLMDKALDLLEQHSLRGEYVQVRQLLQNILEFDIKHLSEAQKTRIETWLRSLDGVTFSERLRRYVGEQTFSESDEISDDSSEYNKILRALAREVLGNQNLLETEFEWLLSSSARNAFYFGIALGELDNQQVMSTSIEFNTKKHKNPMLFAGYLRGQYVEYSKADVDNRLVMWVSAEPELADVVLHTILNGSGSDHYLRLLIELTEKGWIEPVQLSRLRYGRWLDHISGEAINELIATIMGIHEFEHVGLSLELIHSWMYLNRSNFDLVQESARTVIGTIGSYPVETSEKFRWYTWKQVAESLVSQYPEEVVNATLPTLDHKVRGPNAPDDDRLYILCRALEIDEVSVWILIGEKLLKDYTLRFKLQNQTQYGNKPPSNPLDYVSVDILIKWINEDISVRAKLIASLVKVTSDPLPELARQLIIQFGDISEVKWSLSPLNRGGIFTGSESNMLRGKLSLVESWIKDSNALIRKWARDMASEVKMRIKKVEAREAEDELFW